MLQEELDDRLGALVLVGSNPFQSPMWHLWVDFNVLWHFLFVWVYWIIILQDLPICVFWAAQLLRLPALGSLLSYIKSKEMQASINVSTVAFAKFILLIFLSTHYVGLIFYWLCIIARFDMSLETESWVIQFEVVNNISVDTEALHMHMQQYMLCVYKGLNSLANLGYESVVPKRYDELVLSIVTFLFQMVVEAYILGELTSMRRADSSQWNDSIRRSLLTLRLRIILDNARK